MSAITEPDEEELYLLAILLDDTGIDMAEFMFLNEETTHGRFRCYDYQFTWWNDQSEQQIDQSGRNLGKSWGIQLRSCAFPFSYPDQDMLLTAPELNHLKPLVDAVEARIFSSRIMTEMLPTKGARGVNRQPQWQITFLNGAKIVSRLPNKDGKGVKGQHVVKLEIDEAQDYPLAGWIEIVECLNKGSAGAQWRIHGVSKGGRDKFYEFSQSPDWVVHRMMGMHRPTWSRKESDQKAMTYGGSRQSPDYKRNIYGEHGDATNPLFVLARLMACVDQDPGSEYNQDIYAEVHIQYEDLQGRSPVMMLDGKLSGAHKIGWAGAPKGYSAYYAGMDVGATIDPTEILVFGQRAGTSKEQLDLLTRVQMLRISMEDQEAIVGEIFRFYGDKLITFGIDRTGLGFPVWERLAKRFNKKNERVKGYNFSGKYAVALEDREMEEKETVEDLVIERNIVEFASDALREVVDAKSFLLPFDRELLIEWQGQSYTITKATGGPYGMKKQYSQGSFHTLDAGKVMIAGKRLHALDEMLNAKQQQGPVLDAFLGAF
jgi:hypothetical protein